MSEEEGGGSIDRMVSWLRCLLDVSHSAGNTRENLIFFKPRMSRRKRFNLSPLAISRGLPAPFHVKRRDDARCLLGNDISSKFRVNFGLEESIDIASMQIDFDSVV